MSDNINEPWGDTVLVEFDEHRIAWVRFNRPDKRNAMNPTFNREMFATLEHLEDDDRCAVVVLTGSDDAFSAGMDLKEYFRETDGKPRSVQHRVRGEGTNWQYRKLLNYAKPTIAMVNGWCFGGAFVPLVSCDLAIASEDATFGLSEVNWGVTPGNLVTRALAETIPTRDAMYYIMTGQHFDGKRARRCVWSTKRCPADQLRDPHHRARPAADQPEPVGGPRGEDGLPALAADVVGGRRGLPLRQARPGDPVRYRCPLAGHDPVPRRQDVPPGPGNLRHHRRVGRASMTATTESAVVTVPCASTEIRSKPPAGGTSSKPAA